MGRPVLFGTTDEFLKRFQISSLDELPDYDELINKISLLHGDDNDDYLYKKDVFIEESAATDVSDLKNNDKEDDFELPDINDEEIPDFLDGEDVEKF